VGKPIPLPDTALDLDVGEGAVWVTTAPFRPGEGNSERGTLVRVDPSPHRIVGLISVGRGPRNVAAGEGAVWVANADDDSVSRIDPSTNRVAATIRVGKHPTSIFARAGAVWVRTEIGEATVHRIDPASSRVTGHVEVGLQNVGPDAVWVVGHWAPNGALRRLDPDTFQPVGPVLGFDIIPISVGIVGRDVWVGKYFYYCERHNPIPEGPPIVSFAWFQVDPATLRALSAPVFVGQNPETPTFAGGSFWMAPTVGNEVIRIELATAGQVQALPTPGLPSPASP
jgi:YVTN family beta-propeller protein